MNSNQADNLHLLKAGEGTQTACTCGKSFGLLGVAQQHASLMNGYALEQERRRLEQVNDLLATDSQSDHGSHSDAPPTAPTSVNSNVDYTNNSVSDFCHNFETFTCP